MIGEVTAGAVLNLEAGKGGITTLQEFKHAIDDLLIDARRKVGGPVDMYGLPTDFYPGDPDDPTKTWSDDESLARTLGHNFAHIDACAYWFFDIPKSDEEAVRLARELEARTLERAEAQPSA